MWHYPLKQYQMKEGSKLRNSGGNAIHRQRGKKEGGGVRKTGKGVQVPPQKKSHERVGDREKSKKLLPKKGALLNKRKV